MLYAFEDFSLDTERRELRRGGALLSLQPQVFDVLQYLINNREHVVSKDDLIASVWSGRIISESTLSSRINAARHAIDDSGEGRRLIRTVSRKGVRFVGVVRKDRDEGAEAGGLAPTNQPRRTSKKLTASATQPSSSASPSRDRIRSGILGYQP